MKLFKAVLIGGIGLYLLNKLMDAAAASALNFRVRGIGFSGGAVILDLVAQNSFSTGFYINSLTGDLLIGNNAVGNISLFQRIYVAPTSESVIPVTVRVNIFGAYELIKDFLGKKLGDTTLSVVGKVNVGDISYPLNLSFKA